MQQTAQRIFETEGLIESEDKIASVNELFRLQGADELAQAEQRYFSSTQADTQAIILGASRGSNFASLTNDRPKIMLPIGGKPLLRRTVDKCKKRGIDNIVVVAGYKAKSIDVSGIEVVVNKDYASTGELSSLNIARHVFTDDMVIMYGDLLFRSYILRDLTENDAPLTVVVDSSSNQETNLGTQDYAYSSERDDRSSWGQAVELRKIDSSGGENADGRWIGMMRATGVGVSWITEAMEQLQIEAGFENLGIPELLNRIIDNGHKIRVWYIHGHWLDVNSAEDLERAGSFTAEERY